MHSIKDEIRIHTTAHRAFEALVRQADYRAWWNAVGEIDERVGGEAKLHFVKDGQPIDMRFRIDAQVLDTSVTWTCVAHDMPSWVGTTLGWTIRATGESALVALDHGGWKDAAPEPVATGWRHFLASLKLYLESGAGQPW